MTYVTSVLVVVAVVQTWLAWKLARSIKTLPRLEDRVAHLAHSLALLTDTTEGCFQAVATELNDRQARATAARRDTRQRRVVGAAKRGRSVSQIAAQEAVSESEVELRLHFARQSEDRAGEESHAPVCP